MMMMMSYEMKGITCTPNNKQYMKGIYLSEATQFVAAFGLRVLVAVSKV
jgi:hypothetical protein